MFASNNNSTSAQHGLYIWFCMINKAIKMQKMEQKEISVKLDKVAKLLSEVLESINKETSEISPALRKKLMVRWKAIEQGRVKLHHYRSLAEFDKSIG